MTTRMRAQASRPAAKMAMLHPILSALHGAWSWLRQVTGDAAYENYLRHAKSSTAERLLSRREFYLDSLRRRYATPSRCC
jgi:uncharacterized short protein YbdD (DUF466 family)